MNITWFLNKKAETIFEISEVTITWHPGTPKTPTCTMTFIHWVIHKQYCNPLINHNVKAYLL